MIVLILTPEALVEPGFQMSFAATTALVAVFAWIRDLSRDGSTRRLPGWLRPVVTVVISSAVAGLATAPIGAAHFNQVSHYGLAANLLSVPIMGAVIMPLAVLAALLAVVRLEAVALLLMDWPSAGSCGWRTRCHRWMEPSGKCRRPPDISCRFSL